MNPLQSIGTYVCAGAIALATALVPTTAIASEENRLEELRRLEPIALHRDLLTNQDIFATEIGEHDGCYLKVGNSYIEEIVSQESLGDVLIVHEEQIGYYAGGEEVFSFECEGRDIWTKYRFHGSCTRIYDLNQDGQVDKVIQRIIPRDRCPAALVTTILLKENGLASVEGPTCLVPSLVLQSWGPEMADHPDEIESMREYPVSIALQPYQDFFDKVKEKVPTMVVPVKEEEK